jgi:hypothetical protein
MRYIDIGVENLYRPQPRKNLGWGIVISASSNAIKNINQ